LSGNIDVKLAFAIVAGRRNCTEQAAALDVAEEVLAKLGGGPKGT